MDSVLVTGGTGTLGAAVVRRLVDEVGEVRVLSRRAATSDREPFRRMVGDLSTGAGLAPAVVGTRAIVHCATSNGRGDIEATRQLVEAVRQAGGDPHLIHVSIVGVDRIGLPYYRAKLATEGVVATSGLPWTILRATQFHDLLATIFDWQRLSPVTLTLKQLRFQPIDTRDVARRLSELVSSGAAGRVPDIGGPEVIAMRDLAALHRAARQRRRPVAEVPFPGAVARQFAAGHNLAPQNPFGQVTFEQFLAGDGAA